MLAGRRHAAQLTFTLSISSLTSERKDSQEYVSHSISGHDAESLEDSEADSYLPPTHFTDWENGKYLKANKILNRRSTLKVWSRCGGAHFSVCTGEAETLGQSL